MSYLLLSLPKPLVFKTLAGRDLVACGGWPGDPCWQWHTCFNVVCVCTRSQSRLWRLWSAQGANPSCCAQDFVSVGMVLISLWHIFGQVSPVYPKPPELMLLKSRGEHKGLNRAFGSASTVGMDSIDSPAGGNKIIESQNSIESMEIHGVLPV